MQYDTIVVGSGIGGLTAAALLLRKGKSVLLLEQHPLPGGSIRGFKRGGTLFDVGFHYTGCMADGQILERIWNYCGVKDGIPRQSHVDGFDCINFSDGSTIKAYFNYDRFSEELYTQFPREKKGIDTYFKTVQEIADKVPFYNLGLPLTPFLHNQQNDRRVFAEFLYDQVDDPRLRQSLSVLNLLYGVPIAEVSLQSHAFVSHSYYEGAWTVDGGGQRIVDAFVSKIQELGGTIRTGCRVEEFLAQGDSVAGVRLAGGEELRCAQVIYSGHPSAVAEMVPAGVFRPAYLTRLRELRNSISFFALFGRTEKSLAGKDRALNYFWMKEDGNSTFKTKSVPWNERLLFLTGFTDKKSDSLQAQENGIILLRPCLWEETKSFAGTPRSKEYLCWKEERALSMLEEVAKDLGDECGEIEILATGSPLTFGDELLTPDGCPYGVMHCLGQYSPGTRTRLKGFYLAGQSVLMTGVVGASVSAISAVGEIVGLEELWSAIREG